MSKTNDTTSTILDFLFRAGIFAWRENVSPIPVSRNGVITGFRSGGISGKPDIIALRSPGGQFVGIEVKTGKDKLREAQIGFHTNARKAGAIILVVKDFKDFKEQWYAATSRM